MKKGIGQRAGNCFVTELKILGLKFTIERRKGR